MLHKTSWFNFLECQTDQTHTRLSFKRGAIADAKPLGFLIKKNSATSNTGHRTRTRTRRLCARAKRFREQIVHVQHFELAIAFEAQSFILFIIGGLKFAVLTIPLRRFETFAKACCHPPAVIHFATH